MASLFWDESSREETEDLELRVRWVIIYSRYRNQIKWNQYWKSNQAKRGWVFFKTSLQQLQVDSLFSDLAVGHDDGELGVMSIVQFLFHITYHNCTISCEISHKDSPSYMDKCVNAFVISLLCVKLASFINKDSFWCEFIKVLILSISKSKKQFFSSSRRTQWSGWV